MRTNVLYMLKSMDKQDVGLQLALQCASVITGIKVSNLFIIDKNMVEELYDIIDGTDISAFFLYADEIKAARVEAHDNKLELANRVNLANIKYIATQKQLYNR